MHRTLQFFILCGMFILIPESFSQTVNISGTVKNNNGDVISNAKVFLQNHPEIYEYTGADGSFVLSGTIVAISTDNTQRKCLIEDGIITLFCTNESFDIEIYGLSGILINSLHEQNNLYGQFSFDMTNLVLGEGSIYIVRTRIGNKIFTHKYFASQKNTRVEPISVSSLQKSARSTIDNIVILHDSYETKTVAISAYTQTVGLVTMNAKVLNYSFPGGSLESLKAVSPSLSFSQLSIDGKLTIPSSSQSVVITADELHINAYIDVEYPTCFPYYDAPDITLNVNGQVYVNHVISLSGEFGKGEPTNATCNSCNGTDGGTLTINAQNITISERIDAGGGWGSYAYITSSIKCGCSGGDGGDIILNATGSLSIGPSGADLDVEGGEGGSGSLDCGPGSDGENGFVDFESPNININEISGDLNMYTHNAQILDYEKLSLFGNVKYREEIDHRGGSDTWYISYQPPNTINITLKDWLEDLFLLQLSESSTVQISLTASNPNADLDLYLLPYDMSRIIGESNSSTSNENITTAVLPAGYYFIAVSYCDDGGNYSTGYTLKLKQ